MASLCVRLIVVYSVNASKTNTDNTVYISVVSLSNEITYVLCLLRVWKISHDFIIIVQYLTYYQFSKCLMFFQYVALLSRNVASPFSFVEVKYKPWFF